MSPLNLSEFVSLKSFIADHGTALTIGNFDGCHVGHQRLIEDVLKVSREHGLASTALSFDPPPELFFKTQSATKRLFTTEQKARALKECGIETVVIANFDQAFSQISHDDFLNDLLIKQMKMQSLSIGDNFRFGKNRIGNTAFLQEKLSEKKLRLRVLEHSTYQDQPTSSSRIREHIARGDVKSAAEMLGRAYAIEGTVERGQQMGRKLGFPTLNLGSVNQLSPDPAVYSGYVTLSPDRKSSLIAVPKNAFRAVFNIGYRPTIKDGPKDLTIEAHLIDGTYGLDQFYDFSAAFYFAQKLRNEKKFSNLDELKRAIGIDVATARKDLSQI